MTLKIKTLIPVGVISVAAGVAAILWAGGCGGRPSPSPQQANCMDVSNCTSPEPCETLEGAQCVDSLCEYPAKACNTPPTPECVNGDSVYRTYDSQGTCQADGTCLYVPTDTACANCSATCFIACQGIVCDDTHAGCRSGHCVPGTSAGEAAHCEYTPATEGKSCDDGQACTHTDHCDGAGACVGTSITCEDDAGTCGANKVCNGTPSCAVTYPSSGTSCDDVNDCTDGDQCNGAGLCAGKAGTCAAVIGHSYGNYTVAFISTAVVPQAGQYTFRAQNGNDGVVGLYRNGAIVENLSYVWQTIVTSTVAYTFTFGNGLSVAVKARSGSLNLYNMPQSIFDGNHAVTVPVSPSPQEIAQGTAYGDYVVASKSINGAPAGVYTWYAQNGTDGFVKLYRSGVYVETLHYDGLTTVTSTEAYTFTFSGLSIAVRKAGTGSMTLENMPASIFDGAHKVTVP